MGFFKKYKFEIRVPTGVRLEWFANKLRFIGTKEDLFDFVGEFRKLGGLKNGDLVKLDQLTLKVSDFHTPEGRRENWVELPAAAWGILAGKFYDVWEGFEENPFDFNDCGYTDRLPFDLGIEIIDLPLSDALLFDSPHLKAYRQEAGELYLWVEDRELFDFVEDRLVEDCGVETLYHEESMVDGRGRYRLYVEAVHEERLGLCLEGLDLGELEGIWGLGRENGGM